MYVNVTSGSFALAIDCGACRGWRESKERFNRSTIRPVGIIMDVAVADHGSNSINSTTPSRHYFQINSLESLDRQRHCNIAVDAVLCLK